MSMFAVLALVLAPVTSTRRTDVMPPLVTTEWLAQHLGDRDLVIFHIGDPRSRPVYDQGHVPGARFLNPFIELAAPASPGGLTLELPGAAQLDSVLEAQGVSNDSRIVVYSAMEYFTPTSRAFFTLEYAGLRGRVAILDGGLETWKQENRPLSTAAPPPPRGSFTPSLQADMVVDAAWVQSRRGNARVAILDARAPQFYNGAENHQARVGHIPGAQNVPFNTVLAEGRFKEPVVLRAMLTQAGAEPGDTVVTYCHIGQQASLVWLTARLLGYHAAIYDGSFQDWSARRDLPVVAPPAATRDSLVVAPEWLQQHLGDSTVVVLHADRSRAGYDTAHIAGARYVELSRFTTTRDGLTSELPPVDQLLALVKELGISNRSRVILYGDPLSAARFFFTMDYLGHGNLAAMLDGGLAAWRAAGGTVTRDVPTVVATEYQPRAWSDLVVTADWVKARLADSTTAILDARSSLEYRGERPDTTLPRQGHIAGAGNVDWRTTLVDGRLRPVAELRKMFELAGAGPYDEVVTYCGVGLRASHLYFVSRYLGYRTRLYDGSLAEWTRRADLPMETSR